MFSCSLTAEIGTNEYARETQLKTIVEFYEVCMIKAVAENVLSSGKVMGSVISAYIRTPLFLIRYLNKHQLIMLNRSLN